MPNIVTHYVMAKEVEKQLSLSLQELIEQHQETFILGTLGPDIFLYYHVFPWNNLDEAQDVQNVGNAIHAQEINLFFSSLLQRIKLYKKDPEVISYMIRFFCHFALDLTTHPFIYFYTQSKNKPYDFYFHRLFESRIDGLLLYALRQGSPLNSNFKPYQLVHFNKRHAHLLHILYNPILKNIYHKNYNVHVFEMMLKDCYTLHRLLYDPYGIKRQIVTKMEKWSHKHIDALSMIIPFNQEDKWDVLNLQHHDWQHPVTGQWSRTSFINLFLQSIPEAIQLINEAILYLDGRQNLKAILSIVSDRSFDTGIQWNNKMIYFREDSKLKGQ